MADTSVPITPGTGVNVDGFTQANGDVRQAVVLGDASGAQTTKVGLGGDLNISLTSPNAAAAGMYATLAAYGYQRVATEPTSLFYDSFDTSTGLDTANRWATSGTVAPTVSTGGANLNQGVTASASSALQSQPMFSALGVSYLVVGWTGRFEAASAVTGAPGYLNTHRFMGLGQAPTTWVAAYTASASTGPLLQGYGFEVDVDGLMYPVVYDNGVRTRGALLSGAANLNVGRTLFDGNVHQFLMVVRAEAVFWYVDGTEVPVASYTFRTAGFSQPDIANLPLRLHAINATTAATGTPLLRVGAIGVGDTGKNSIQIADGTYPWRKAKVDTNSNLAVNLGGSGGLPQVIGSITAAGANTIGVASTTSTTGQVVTNVAAAGNVTFHLVSAAFVGTLIFEASVDGGLNYGPIMAVREDGTGSETGTTLSVAAAFIRQYTSGIPGMTWFRVRCSTYTSGAVAVVIAPGPFLIEPTPSLGGSTAQIGLTRDVTASLAGVSPRTLFNAAVLTLAVSTTEAMASLIPARAGANGTAGQSVTVTAGRALRLSGWSIAGATTAAAAASMTVRLRVSASATTSTASTVVDVLAVSIPTATVGFRASAASAFPDGIDIPAGYSFGVSVLGTGGTVDIALHGYEYA